MTVKELIQLLEECNPDYPLYFESCANVIERITDLEEDDETQSVTLY